MRNTCSLILLRCTAMLLFLTIASCSTISVKDQVLKDYAALTVPAVSEVTQEQAKVIAQKKLIDRFLYKNYKLAEPAIVAGPQGAPDVDRYWYVQFGEPKPSSIPDIFMVVVRKEDGKVCFSNDYPEDKEWILEAVLYRLRKP